MLQGGVDGVRLGLGTVAHEADGGLAVLVATHGVVYGLDNGDAVLGGGQQRRTDRDGVELRLVVLELLHDVLVLESVHEMRGLHDHALHSLSHDLVHGLLEVVDMTTRVLLNVVDDRLRGEGPTHIVGRKRLADVRLDGADGDVSARGVARAEAHDQDDWLWLGGSRRRVGTACLRGAR